MPLAVAVLASFLLVGVPPAPASLRDAISAVRVSSSQATEKAAPPDRLVFRPRVDIPVTAAATAAWIIAEADKTHLVAVTCKWCDRAPDGTDALNGLDAWGRRAFVWHDSGHAITASNITAFVLAPAAAYGLDWRAARRDGRESDFPADAILITQVMAVASDVTELLKFTIGRERPFVHVLAPGARAETAESADNNTSFPSGHTTLAFALATSSAEIARLRGYTQAAWILRLGLPVAVATAYFRVAADRHYVTDVFAGAAVGSGVGFGLPYLAHRKKPNRKMPAVSITPVPGGHVVAARWDW